MKDHSIKLSAYRNNLAMLSLTQKPPVTPVSNRPSPVQPGTVQRRIHDPAYWVYEKIYPTTTGNRLDFDC